MKDIAFQPLLAFFKALLKYDEQICQFYVDSACHVAQT